MKLKSNLISNKKGYLQIDISFAILLFFIFFTIIYFFYIDSLKSQSNDFETTILNSYSNDICKLLISNSGNPNNWEENISNLKNIGILKINEKYIDPNKILALNILNYENITRSLGFNNILNIKIINISDNYIYLDFGASSTRFGFVSSSSVCYSIYNNTNPVKIIVEVWE